MIFITGELGVTKGALYKHYRNEKVIFSSIIAHVERQDLEHIGEYGVAGGNMGRFAENEPRHFH